MKGVTEGRAVHYVLTGNEDLVDSDAVGQHRAATIVRSWGDKPHEGNVNLSVHVDGYNDLVQTEYTGVCPSVWVTSVFYSKGQEPGTWHWPEQA